jgi:Family of unknown function (DUF5709)
MPAEWRHESEDLEDYTVLDSSDTLAGAPGDDPLDRGVATPERWSAVMRFGSTAEEQLAGESLDQLLAEEDPDESLEPDDDRPYDVLWDGNASDDDIARFAGGDSPDPRTGRLITTAADDARAVYPAWDTDATARDVGIDGGGATAEEAALHYVADSDTGF